MAPPTKLDILRSDREMIAIKIEFYKGELAGQASTPLQIEHVELYLKETNAWWKKAEENFRDIKTLNPADLEDDKTEFFSLLRNLKAIQAELYPIYKSFHKATPTPPPPPPLVPSTVKLPKIEIQSFDGDYLEWTTFKESFIAAIHMHPQLSKVQKFSYLKSLLKGEAARYTADLALTDANYDQALSQLNDRYENKRKIATAILDQMFNHPVIHDSSTSARSLVDSTSRCIRSLELIGIKKEEMWDTFCSYVCLSKLDASAKEKFEYTVQDTEVPKIAALCKFLEKHANSLDEIKKAEKSTDRKSEQHSTNQQHNKSQYKCQYCHKTAHSVFYCSEFKAAEVRDRIAFVRKLNLCYNCLRAGHAKDNCRISTKCQQCNENHHSLLHYDYNDNSY